MKNRTQLISAGRRLHRIIGWLAAVALIWFIASGLLHILMVWTGPQAAKFFPPQATVSATELQQVPQILADANIATAQLVQVVPTAKGNALQITEADDLPRRYFDLQSGDEWPDYDIEQARWLAGYFTGLETADINAVEVQQTFERDYPWVNRLLPVYRVSFESADDRTAYIYTEFAALAGLTNNWKNNVQSWFQYLHTWEWLAFSEPLRVTVMLVLLGSVFLMLISGLVMRFVITPRRIPQPGRRWHRRLSLLAVVAILIFLVSGIWHLLVYAGSEREQGLKLPPPVNLKDINNAAEPTWLENYRDQPVQGITLLNGPDEALYRVALPAGNMHDQPGHHHRFDGQQTEQPARYYSIKTGQQVALTDEILARHQASRVTGLDASQISTVSRVSHFSPEYDFRNKRLPVWRVDFNDADKTTLFIDAASGMRVDQSNGWQRLEGNIFATLHKWAQLGHLAGTAIRDALMVLLVLMIVGFAGLGVRMLIRR